MGCGFWVLSCEFWVMGYGFWVVRCELSVVSCGLWVLGPDSYRDGFLDLGDGQRLMVIMQIIPF